MRRTRSWRALVSFRQKFTLSIAVSLVGSLGYGQSPPEAAVADFCLRDALSGDSVCLHQYVQPWVLLVFINTDCPYGKVYETRLAQLRQQFPAEQLGYVCISPEAEADGEMQHYGRTHHYQHAFLQDERQILSRRLGIEKVPEVVLLQRRKGRFYVRYRGAIDDSPHRPEAVQQSYLQQALRTLQRGQAPAVPQRRATGCHLRTLSQWRDQ